MTDMIVAEITDKGMHRLDSLKSRLEGSDVSEIEQVEIDEFGLLAGVSVYNVVLDDIPVGVYRAALKKGYITSGE